jgi:hypothetical protein
MIKSIYCVCMYNTSYSLRILVKLEFSWTIFDKFSSIKLQENPSVGNQLVPCGQTGQSVRQTDRHDEANSRFSKFYERAWNNMHFLVRMISITKEEHVHTIHSAVGCNSRNVNYTHHTRLFVVTMESLSPRTTLSSVFQAVRKPLCRGHHIRLIGWG